VLRKLGKDVSTYGAGDLLFRILAFAIFPIYANVFSVEEFGVYALVSTSVGIAALLANMGLNNAVQRYYWESQTDPGAQIRIVSTGLYILMASSVGIVLLVLVSLYPINDLVASRYGISWIVALIALLTIIPEQVVQYCLDILRLHFAAWKFVLLSFLKNLLGVAVGLVLILLFDGRLEALFFGGLAGAVAAVPIALVYIRRDLALAYCPKTAKCLFTFGYPFIFAGIAYWLFGTVDRWMLAELSDATQVGLYGIAYKFAAIVLFLNSAFGQAWSPFALKLRQDDLEYRVSYAQVFSLWFFLLTIAGSAIALLGKEALYLFTPPEYWAASSSLGVLVMSIVLSGTTQITAVGISLERKTRLFVVAAWTTTVANILLNFFFIPVWGATGAAIATFLSYGILTTLYLFWSQRLHPIPLEKEKLIYSSFLVILIVVASVSFEGMETTVHATLLKFVLLGLMVTGGAILGIVDIAVAKKFVLRKPRA
jgi:O-antigen/teichoic acid export membrane protein